MLARELEGFGSTGTSVVTYWTLVAPTPTDSVSTRFVGRHF